MTEEQLAALAENLRGADFKVGPAHHIDARRLLLELAARRQDINSLTLLTAYLAPIYCASKTQQQQFAAILESTLHSRVAAPLGQPEEVLHAGRSVLESPDP